MLFKASYCCYLIVATCYKVTISKDMSPRCQAPMTGFGVAHHLMIFICTRCQVLQTIVVPLSRSHTVRVTYVGVQAGHLGTWIQSIHRSIWLMDFEEFQESRSVAEAPQMYSEPLSNSVLYIQSEEYLSVQHGVLLGATFGHSQPFRAIQQYVCAFI